MVVTERLILRKPAKEDFERFFEINHDPETNIHNPSGPMSFEKAENTFTKMLDHWGTHHFGSWAVAEKESPENIIGFGGLSYKLYGDKEKLNLGYRFASQAWGKGYATEFTKKAIDFGFKENNEEIFAIVRPTNIASVKVLEKAGMIKIGTLNDVPGQPESLVYRIQK
ncbi:GNAT family N-acetyltransferase [Chryseobacterium sediminis]|uniref:GNAT family N-acetyltransferase n=1 Tax=Chryseobacterium sediminis TaxID=1679494 RepID=UPI0028639984|nr:GNAT family N-acetyltransferase [Chryseobacterium sediminis]MDR6463886.1 RimJ/RimL family protein N-acetyltransferase [Chryseobacterium sediminis]